MEHFPRRRALFPQAHSGFTLVELLVVVIITAFLASLIFSYGRGGRELLSLTVERAKVAQVIFRARSLAVSTFNQPSPPCAYGVHFNYANRRYELSAYTAAPCSSITSIAGLGVARETYTLDPAVAFGSGSTAISDVLFFPPDPTTVLYTDPFTTSTAGAVYLVSASGASSSTISLTSAGQVTF